MKKEQESKEDTNLQLEEEETSVKTADSGQKNKARVIGNPKDVKNQKYSESEDTVASREFLQLVSNLKIKYPTSALAYQINNHPEGVECTFRLAKPGTAEMKVTKEQVKDHRKDESHDDLKAENTQERKDGKQKLNQKSRPNAFIGVQIENRDILNAIKEVQDACVQSDDRLAEFCVPIVKSHVTLLVLHIPEDRVDEAKDILEKVTREKIDPSLEGGGFEVEFQDVGTFPGDRVLYAKPICGTTDRFSYINEVCSAAFEEEGFDVCDYSKPHLTLLKSTYVKKGNSLKKIPKECHDNFKDKYFGRHKVTKIQLVSMNKPVSSDGYYYCECQYQFQ